MTPTITLLLLWATGATIYGVYQFNTVKMLRLKIKEHVEIMGKVSDHMEDLTAQMQKSIDRQEKEEKENE